MKTLSGRPLIEIIKYDASKTTETNRNGTMDVGSKIIAPSVTEFGRTVLPTSASKKEQIKILR